MRIKEMTMGIIIFVIIFGGIGATLAVDLWSTTSEKIPVKIKDGEYAGDYNPADIRGSYTFDEVSELFEIDLKVLYKAFGIPLDTKGAEIQTKDLENIYKEESVEIGNEAVRVFVALYKGLPIDLDETYLPQQAVKLILQENDQLTEEQKNYLVEYSIVIITNNLEEINSEKTILETSKNDPEEAENVVNGTATFQKVIDAGVTKLEIERIINAPMPPTNQTVKDYCINAGLSFSNIKDQLNDLIK